MAARQDQTQTIISITFGILFFVMSILAYLGYSSAKSEFARAEELAKQGNDQRQAATKAIGENEELLTMIGLDPAMTFADVQTRFDADKQQYMANFDPGDQSYRQVLDLVFAENEKIAQQENAAKTEVKRLQDSMNALAAEWKLQFETAMSEADKAKQDLADERVRFKTERDQIEAQERQLAATLSRKEKEFAQRARSAEEAKAVAENELVTTRRAIIDLQDRVEKANPSFEIADGQVTYVNQANGVAWINLGSADDLRRQVTFSVFASEFSDAAKAEKKGSLEVTRIMGDNVAETRITSDDPRDPILPGDRIYSQIWEAGKPLRFGFAGLIDVDGDGSSDLRLVKELVELNGAIVDVAAEDDGEITGQMTVNTNYLILGDSPEQPNKAVFRDKYQELSKQAADLGVDTVSLRDFLNRIGYKPAESNYRFTGGGVAPNATGGAARSYRFATP